MRDVPDINSESGEKQRKTESQDIFDDHNHRKIKKGMEIKAVLREYDYGKNDDESIEHVDELACDKGNRKNFSRKIDFLNQIPVNKHAVRTRGHTRADKNPRNQSDEQKKIVFFNLLSHQDRKDKCINDELQQRIKESPEKSEHRSFVPPPQLLMNKAENHLAVFVNVRE